VIWVSQRLEKEESGVSTHELASGELRQAPLELGLGHSAVVAWEVELAPSVVRTGELLKRTCGSIGRRFQQGIERAASAQHAWESLHVALGMNAWNMKKFLHEDHEIHA
jgi:hypothetical protein